MHLIGGLLRYDGEQVEPRSVHAILDAMQPEKPSCRAVRCSGPVGLGVLSAASSSDNQSPEPNLSEADSWVMVADARMYALGAKQVPTDLLHAWHRNGSDLLADVHGDFAFACWNPHRKTLTLQCDHFGVRPLHYTHRPGRYFAFASLPHGLLRTGLARSLLDHDAVQAIAFIGRTTGTGTPFRDIFCVGQASAVSVTSSGSVSARRTWRMPLPKRLSAATDRREIAAEVQRLFAQAVQRRLPEDQNVGVHISGGLDSSAVAMVAAQQVSRQIVPILGFGIVEAPEDGVLDPPDTRLAALVADADDRIAFFPGSACLPRRLAEDIDPHVGRYIGENHHEEQFASNAAAQGASVVLSGWVGDEVVTSHGINGLSELCWSTDWRGLRAMLAEHAGFSGASMAYLILRNALPPVLPLWIRNLGTARRSTRATIDTLASGIAGFCTDPGARNLVPRRKSYADSRWVRRASLERAELTKTLQDFAFTGARHGVSYAFPMADLDLISFALSIPAALNSHRGLNRVIFRTAMQGIVPEEVLARVEKTGPLPGTALRMARQREALIEECDVLGANPLVRRHIRTDRLRQFLLDSATEEEALDALRKRSHGGEWSPSTDIIPNVLMLARFLYAQDRIRVDCPAFPDHVGAGSA